LIFVNTFTAFIMSGLGEGSLACSPPTLPTSPPMLFEDQHIAAGANKKSMITYTVIDKLVAKMDEHINNMVLRHNTRANPDITLEILDKLVNGEVRPRAMAITQVYYNATERMLDWDMDRRKEYNRDSGLNRLSYRGCVRIYKSRSHRYKMLHQMLSPNFDPQDRVAIEYTSEDKI